MFLNKSTPLKRQLEIGLKNECKLLNKSLPYFYYKLVYIFYVLLYILYKFAEGI